MAGGFAALGAFLDDVLELPVTGRDGVERTYRIEDPSAEDGIKIEKITSLAARLVAGGAAVDTQMLDDEEEIDLYRMCLGDSYDTLLKDLRWSRFKHVALTVMFWITADRDTAEQYWNTGLAPGKARNREDRRREKRDSSASDAGSTTQSRSSTSGTRAGSRRRKGGGAGRR
ncbi:hypothetical protein [Streptomyces sp. IB2014 016-6]|uniref:DUF7426 family protein n=1 Tax=Streptomyces sp. IB2014 016-6 TaxID=2517818 RepID=UPI0011CC1C1A|nr:hypothetical protein [Streptomyces sp. IB2014 016-6]TXL91578.1 hypothetical protein EW053_04430 [Streptomyces sp. IB2014 016-6]